LFRWTFFLCFSTFLSISMDICLHFFVFLCISVHFLCVFLICFFVFSMHFCAFFVCFPMFLYVSPCFYQWSCVSRFFWEVCPTPIDLRIHVDVLTYVSLIRTFPWNNFCARKNLFLSAEIY
jgi:hypothetical protein